MLVRNMAPLPGYDTHYEVKIFNHKFRPVTIWINKTHEFESIEDGRFKAIDWR